MGQRWGQGLGWGKDGDWGQRWDKDGVRNGTNLGMGFGARDWVRMGSRIGMGQRWGQGLGWGSGMGMGQSWMGTGVRFGVRDGIKMESGTGSGMGGRNGGKDGVRDWDGGQGWDKAGWELGPGLGSGMGDEMTGWEEEKNRDKTGRDKEHSRLGQQEKPRTGVRDGKSWSRTGTTTHLSPPSLPL